MPPKFGRAGPLLHPFAVRRELKGHFNPPVLVLASRTKCGLKRVGALFPWYIHQEEFTTPSPMLNCAKRSSPSNGQIMVLRSLVGEVEDSPGENRDGEFSIPQLLVARESRGLNFESEFHGLLCNSLFPRRSSLQSLTGIPLFSNNLRISPGNLSLQITIHSLQASTDGSRLDLERIRQE